MADQDTKAGAAESTEHVHGPGCGHDHVHGPDCDHDHDHGHDHDTGLERGDQKVELSDVGPARKCLSIEVPAERIAKRLEREFGKLREEANIPGFRRGHVPAAILQRRFGQAIRDDVKSQLVLECCAQAIEDHKLDVIGEPEVHELEKLTLPTSGPLAFKVEVEVTPVVALPPLENIEVKKKAVAVSDEDIDQELLQLQRRFGKTTDLTTDAVVGEDDAIQSEVKILPGLDAADTAEPIATYPGTYFMAPSAKRGFKGQIAGILVENLGQLVLGKKLGEVIRVSLQGPAMHEDPKIKDQPITIVARLDRISRVEPSPLDEVAKHVGLDTGDALKARIRENLQGRKDREQKMAQHEQVCDYLMEKVNLELPPGLTRRQTVRVLQRRAMDMAYRGAQDEEIRQKVAELRNQGEEDARKQLKLFFILDQAAKQLEVEVEDTELNGQISYLALQQNRRPEKLRQQMQRSGEMEQLYLQVREFKTLDKILEKCKVVEA